jgi:hypothetical protein
VVEAGGDLDEAVHEQPLVASQRAPHLLPMLVRLEELAAVKRLTPSLEALPERRGGTVDWRH